MIIKIKLKNCYFCSCSLFQYYPCIFFFFLFCFFFFNDTATTEIYTLSLHDALPICGLTRALVRHESYSEGLRRSDCPARSEEHTSELQSLTNLVCRLLLEKKKK